MGHFDTSSLEDGLRRILKTILTNDPNSFGIQLGAFDGLGFDETQPILKELQFPFLFVEPISYYFKIMKNNLSYHPNNKFDNCAVSNEDGMGQMGKFNPASYYENQPMSQRFCLTGMSSLLPMKNHPWESPTEVDIVRTKSLESLLDDNEVTSFNVFHVTLKVMTMWYFNS